MKCLGFAIVLLASMIPHSAGAQSGSDFKYVESLRSNVVRINANIGGKPQHGAGIVVGARAGDIYIVTANHVVRDDKRKDQNGDPLQDGHPSVEFRDEPSPHPAELLSRYLDREKGDLAILRVRHPDPLIWNRKVEAATPEFGENVWYIGQDLQAWYVSVVPGSVNEPAPDAPNSIRVQFLGDVPGASGGPVISKNGIVGMVYDQNKHFSEATPLETIKQFVAGSNCPWDISSKNPGPGSARLAVFASLGDGAVESDLSRFESQLGGSILAAGHYTLVDRKKFETVLHDQRFSRSTSVDATTAAKLGRILGASVILVTKLAVDTQVEPGTFITQIDATTSSDYELLDVSTATVLKSGSCDGSGNEKTTVGGNVAPLQKKARIEALDSCAQTLADQLGQ